MSTSKKCTTMTAIEFLILSLAVFRLGRMLSDVSEDGPADILHKIRYRAGVRYDETGETYGLNWLASGMLCIFCNTIWLGIFFAGLHWLSALLSVYLAAPFALSAAALLVRRVGL